MRLPLPLAPFFGFRGILPSEVKFSQYPAVFLCLTESNNDLVFIFELCCGDKVAFKLFAVEHNA